MTVLTRLRTAETDADALTALAGQAERPTTEQLAEWWPPESPDEYVLRATDLLLAFSKLVWEHPPDEVFEYVEDGSEHYDIFEARFAAVETSEAAGRNRLLAAVLPVRIQTENGLPSRIGRALLGPLALTRVWLACRNSDNEAAGHHPLAPLVLAWQRRPKPAPRRHIFIRQQEKPPKGTEPARLARTPAVASLVSSSVFEAVEVDGVPYATRRPPCDGVGHYLVQPHQGDLFSVPRKLAGSPTAGAVLDALANLASRNERSPLRADIYRLGTLAFALTGAIQLTDSQGAVLVAGRDSPANRIRFNKALWELRCMCVRLPRSKMAWALAVAEPGPVSFLGPAPWMLEGSRGSPTAWRYTGVLFRQPTKWGALERTVGGLEGALAWGRAAGRGDEPRRPDALRPVRAGGPGPRVFVAWWEVLRLAGENVRRSADPKGTERRRYDRRVAQLKDKGYFVDNGTAPIGDTIEIVGRRRGGRCRPAGIEVRASERWCAASGEGGKRVSLGADRLLRMLDQSSGT